MKKLLFILLLTIPFVGCNNKQEDTDKNEITPHTAYYENGQLMMEGNYKDGKLSGLWKSYYESGQLTTEGYMKDGEKYGLWKHYYENGQLEIEGEYKVQNDSISKDGIWKWYYKNGQLFQTANWKYGEFHGLWKVYYENGQLEWEENWKDDELISEKCWDEDGNEIECEKSGINLKNTLIQP